MIWLQGRPGSAAARLRDPGRRHFQTRVLGSRTRQTRSSSASCPLDLDGDQDPVVLTVVVGWGDVGVGRKMSESSSRLWALWGTGRPTELWAGGWAAPASSEPSTRPSTAEWPVLHKSTAGRRWVLLHGWLSRLWWARRCHERFAALMPEGIKRTPPKAVPCLRRCELACGVWAPGPPGCRRVAGWPPPEPALGCPRRPGQSSIGVVDGGGAAVDVV
jgi:hypothetical protein